MPVKTSSGNYVQFKYSPAYMQDEKYDSMIPNPHSIHTELGLNCESSDIVLDGGAMEIHGKKGIVSDRVFRDNRSLKKKKYTLR